MMRNRKLPPLGALRAFEAAARHLSFRKAADELGVTPTAISHQIRLLEDILGFALFIRQVRQVVLTEAGERLYPTLRDGFDMFDRALADLAPAPRRTAVTLTATIQFTARKLLPALGSFRERFPEFDLRLHSSDEPVDLTAGQADVAVRYGRGPFDGLVGQPLFSERFGLLCSPKLGLSAPQDLLCATLLHVEWRRPANAPDWRRWAGLAGMEGLAVDEGPRFNSDDHALQAAVAGHGVAIGSLILARPEIDAGLLVHPFGPVIEGDSYHMLATPANMGCADVRAVCAWLVESVAGLSIADQPLPAA